MPTFTLYITAAVADCTLAKAPDSALRLKLSCGSCREQAATFSLISLSDAKLPVPGSRGEVHLLQRCHMCREQANVTLLKLASDPFDSAALSAPRGAALATVECRGCEPTAFQPGDGWVVATETARWDVTFDEEDAFTEYDEATSCPVSVEQLGGVWRKD